MTEEVAEELFRQVAAFASFGFAKSHAAAFARTAYESSFLKLFYPAQFLVGLINAQPMGFYPVEVLVNDAKRHGVAVLPVDVNQLDLPDDHRVGGAAGVGDAGRGTRGRASHSPRTPAFERRPAPVRSSGCVIPTDEARERWAADSATGWGVRLGLRLVKGIGEEHEALLDAELARGSVPLASRTSSSGRGCPEETLERLIRVGALDSLGRPRRELLWQLREVAGATRGRLDGRSARGGAFTRAASRPMALRLPATEAPTLPGLTESERIGDAYAVVGLDARRQVVGLYRPALERLGAVTNAALDDRKPGRVRIGGLVVTRQHPMTAKGTVFLALEDETGMVNVTLWPDTWARLRGRRPPPRAAAGRRGPPAGVDRRQRHRPRGPAAGRGCRHRRRARAASGRQGTRHGRDAPPRLGHPDCVARQPGSAPPGKDRVAVRCAWGPCRRGVARRPWPRWAPAIRAGAVEEPSVPRRGSGEERSRRDASEQRLRNDRT